MQQKRHAPAAGRHAIVGNVQRIRLQLTDQPEAFKERYRARVPLGRMATPVDVARATRFLASPASGYLTGQELLLDGGLTATLYQRMAAIDQPPANAAPSLHVSLTCLMAWAVVRDGSLSIPKRCTRPAAQTSCGSSRSL